MDVKDKYKVRLQNTKTTGLNSRQGYGWVLVVRWRGVNAIFSFPCGDLLGWVTSCCHTQEDIGRNRKAYNPENHSSNINAPPNMVGPGMLDSESWLTTGQYAKTFTFTSSANVLGLAKTSSRSVLYMHFLNRHFLTFIGSDEALYSV